MPDEKGLVVYEDDTEEGIPHSDSFEEEEAEREEEPIEAEWEEIPDEEEEYDEPVGDGAEGTWGKERDEWRKEMRDISSSAKRSITSSSRRKKKVRLSDFEVAKRRRRGLPSVKVTKATRAVYLPGKKMEYYVPTRMQGISKPPRAWRGIKVSDIGAPMRKASEPHFDVLRGSTTMKLGGLRHASSPQRLAQAPISKLIRPMGAPGAVTIGGQEALLRLRGLTTPPGLSNVEQAAYVEIRANGDVDTPSHVKDELEEAGFARKETGMAIGRLLKKGIIRQGARSGTERELEVVV